MRCRPGCSCLDQDRGFAIPGSRNGSEKRTAMNITHLGNLHPGSPQCPSGRTGSEGHFFLEDGELCDVANCQRQHLGLSILSSSGREEQLNDFNSLTGNFASGNVQKSRREGVMGRQMERNDCWL